MLSLFPVGFHGDGRPYCSVWFYSLIALLMGFELFLAFFSAYLRTATDFSMDMEGSRFSLSFCFQDDYEAFVEFLGRVADKSFSWSDDSDIVEDEEEAGIASSWAITVIKS